MTPLALLQTLLAFLVALGVLVAAHEWGHYRAAVACGVKVLRFSIGFGPPLLRWRSRRPRPGQDTEFVIGAIPLGGYVRMLDEREGEVAPDERARAFNTQPLRKRALIVAAGPVANLVLAVLLYSAVNWIGVEQARAILSTPGAETMAARAGLQGGDTVRRAALAGGALEPVASFESLRWLLSRGVLDRRDVVLEVARFSGGAVTQVTLPTSTLHVYDPDQLKHLPQDIGIALPFMAPVIGELLPGGPAESAGLQRDDKVLRVGDTPVRDWQQLVEIIRASGAQGEPATAWQVERAGRILTLQVRPELYEGQGLVGSGFFRSLGLGRSEPHKDQGQRQRVARIGAGPGVDPAMVMVRYGPLDGLWLGAQRTWEISALTVKLLGQLLAGQISPKNLSGPVAIADLAGQAAHLGLTPFAGFLAYISVCLGLMNLLPLPVLDGGHLAYFLWEAVTGKPVAGVWLERLQYAGLSLLLALMAVALFNDIASRLPG